MQIVEFYEVVKDAEDYSRLASEKLTDYCQTIGDQPGMMRPIDIRDGVLKKSEGDKIYTTFACNLIDAKIVMLHEIGLKYFPGESFEISSNLYIELN